MTTSITDKNLISAKILANVLNSLNPSRTVEEWERHVIENAHNPKKFFANNGEGLAEYEAFCRTYDKDNHNRIRNIKERRR